MDSKDAKENLEAARKKLEGFEIFGCSAAIEVALRKAASQGIIDYLPGGTGFQIIREVSEEQRRALEYMRGFIEANGGTGVQAAINSVVFKVLDNIVVYPVEDEVNTQTISGTCCPMPYSCGAVLRRWTSPRKYIQTWLSTCFMQ